MSKTYTKTEWDDEVLAGDPRYDIKEDGGAPIASTVQIGLATAVIQAGTGVNAERMNNIEEGIDALDTQINEDETGLVDRVEALEEGGGGGAENFLDLEDVPSSYSGQGSKLVRVKAGADGLEFTDPPGPPTQIRESGGPTTLDIGTIADGNVLARAGTNVQGVNIATATLTLTNKRITPRVTSETSSATPTINTDNCDIHRITALAADITNVSTNLSGTPTHGQKLIVEITGTATRTIAWGTSFEGSTVALPTTTDGTNMLAVGFMWNSTTSKWRCIAVA